LNKIRIVNWLLTRKCNLDCDYCAIVKNYSGKPEKYPDMKHYIKNEMSTSYVIKCLKLFKEHNPEAFHILYGGEPLLRKDLPEIINFCNDNNIHYTIISNNTTDIQPLIKNLFDKTDYIQGFTSSVDPVLNYDKSNSDRIIKSIEGFERLKELKRQNKVKDIVAEITVMKSNVNNLFDLVATLSNEGINSDITFIDVAKTPYYDFSNISDEKLLVTKEEAKPQLDKLLNSDLDIHMKEKLLPMIYEILPSEMNCGIENKLHTIAIDADGSIRLCLRIRGLTTPTLIQAHELFTRDLKEITPLAHVCISKDKREYCKLCNHTCYLMGQIIDSEELEVDSLVHKDKREEK